MEQKEDERQKKYFLLTEPVVIENYKPRRIIRKKQKNSHPLRVID